MHQQKIIIWHLVLFCASRYDLLLRFSRLVDTYEEISVGKDRVIMTSTYFNDLI